MRCLYCHNPDTWEFGHAGKGEEGGRGTDMTVAEVLEAFERNRPFYTKGGITVTGGEPMAQPDFVADLFAAAHAQPRGRIHTCLDTSGATYSPKNAARFDALLSETDMVLLDIKTAYVDDHQELCGLDASHARDLGDELNRRHIPTLIRHVVVPGWTDTEEEVTALGRLIGDWDNIVGLDLLPYHTMGTTKYENLGMEYPLKGVPAMSPAKAKQLRQVTLRARAARRAERGLH